MRTLLLCVITQRVVVITYRRFGTTCRSHLQGWRIQKVLLDSWTRKGSVLIHFAAEPWNHAISINVDLIQTLFVHQLPWSANLLQPTPPARRHSWKVATVRFVGTVYWTYSRYWLRYVDDRIKRRRGWYFQVQICVVHVRMTVMRPNKDQNNRYCFEDISDMNFDRIPVMYVSPFRECLLRQWWRVLADFGGLLVPFGVRIVDIWCITPGRLQSTWGGIGEFHYIAFDSPCFKSQRSGTLDGNFVASVISQSNDNTERALHYGSHLTVVSGPVCLICRS
jgi:hypothetical protein